MKKTKLFNRLSRLSSLAICLILASVSLFVMAGHSSAGSLGNTIVRETRMKSAQTAELRVIFKATGAATGFVVNMNGGDSGTAQWTNATPGGIVFNGADTVTSVAGCDVGAVTSTGSPTAAGLTAGTITVSSITGISGGSIYCYDITNGSHNVVTNPTGGHEGQYHPTVAETGAVTDSTTVSLNVVSNDQVTVSAVVPPSFTFAIGGCASNNDTFAANLTTAFVYASPGCTVTVNTNSTNGWFAWASDSSTGLHSTAASATIASTNPNNASAQTLNNGAEGYVFAITGITQGSGSGGTTSSLLGFGNGSGGSATACTSGSSTSCTGGAGLNTTTTAFASSTGTANGAILNIQERTTISGVTKAAADYQDIITLTGAGYF